MLLFFNGEKNMRLSYDSKGFSLVELLVVMAIVGIIATVSVPNLIATREKYRLRGVSRDVVSSFLKAQTEAVKRNTSVGINFDTVNGLCTVFEDNGAGGGTADDVVQNGTEPTIFTTTTSAGTAYTNASFLGNPYTGYDTRGLPLGNRTGSVEIITSANSQVQYSISLSNSGHVKMRVSTDGGTTWQ